MQNFKDYYQILGIPKQASMDEVKQAFRKLARKYHPDVNPNDPQAEEKFKDVNEAYEVLSDTTKRRQYDQFGQYYQQGGFRGGSGSPFGGNPFGGDDFGLGGFPNNVDFTQFDDFQDFIDQLLGRVGGGSPAGGGQRAAGFTGGSGSTSYDAEASIQLTIPEAYVGGKRKLRVEGGKVLEIAIPAGIGSGKKIRLRGQGHPNPNGGNGDLYLKVELREHPFYRLDGSDLYCDLPISPSEAVLGGQVEVPTLDGPVKLRIPAGVQTGQKLRMSQRGFPKRAGERGDQLVILQITVPDKISPQERELYEQLLRIQSYDPRANLKAP
ncbi:MAG: J domain-containing protein [Cyanobacteriota bacterium]|nr:J domain-containing protein [Cyanobacteriota bacterium]